MSSVWPMGALPAERPISEPLRVVGAANGTAACFRFSVNGMPDAPREELSMSAALP